MKKFVCVIGSILFLTGCSMDSVLDKVPFINNDEKVVQKEQQKLNEEVPEKSNVNKEEAVNHGEGKENGQGNKPEKESEDSKLTLEAALFNEVVQVNGKKVIQNATNTMALVNKEFALPDGYTPSDLVRPKVAFSFGDQDIEKSYLRKEAATALELMFSDAVKNGIHLFAVSGYRSFDRQKVVFDAEVNKVGYEKAVQAVAVPGNSEHQSGLSMDISSESAHFGLTEQFGETEEGKWLANNAHRFGFIQRYPKGKEGITGYQYESWHYRFVGVKAATVIFENQLTLEEYFNIVEKI
jgi:zinc D-Ala-D-Ala carboxypeptidase